MFAGLLFYVVFFYVSNTKLKGETSIFERIWNKYKYSIVEFNNKVFKFNIKVIFVPYFYILVINVLGIILYIVTKTSILWIFFWFLLYFLPNIVLQSIQRNRTKQIEKQLVPALIFLGNALKAGLDIVQGLELAIKSLEPPISEEFQQVLKEYHLGITLENALINMRDRVKSTPIETFVTSIIIQRDTGGDVTKIIEQIVYTVRETYKLEGKISTLTAQGRVQAIIVISLPWVLGGLLLAIQPEFMLPMFRNALGTTLLGFLVIWQVIGIFVIKKITTIDV
jgi:tight adherence protein B